MSVKVRHGGNDQDRRFAKSGLGVWRTEGRSAKENAPIALVIECSTLLLSVDCMMHLRSFNALYRSIRAQPTAPMSESAHACQELCHAIDLACVFYFRHVLCLQRSAATTLLLRSRGFAAEMVIGAQMLPFQSHAWVEVNGTVVNDKPYIKEIYQELERC
jgi:hypothetical protein